MKPNFCMLHAEAINQNYNAVCHIVAVQVVDGEKKCSREFFLNPGNEPFLGVSSGISLERVRSFPQFRARWGEVEEFMSDFEVIVSTAEGYSARAIAGTLARLSLECREKILLNAKTLARRAVDRFCYSYDYLAYDLLCLMSAPQCDEPLRVAETWADITIAALKEVEDGSLPDFAAKNRINVGLFSANAFTPCSLKPKNRPHGTPFDASGIVVEGNEDNPLYGLNVVFTGKLESLTRNEARTLVVKAGGFAPERLTTSTNLLVVGVQDIRIVGEKGLSGKMKLAQKYREKGCDIEVIDERDFLELLEWK